MYCRNCGNKLDDNDLVCSECSTLVEREQYKEMKRKSSSNVIGLLCFFFGLISFIMCLNFMIKDISSVGMYIDIYERLLFGLNLVFTPAILALIALVLYLIGRKSNKVLNKVGFGLSILSFIFIISEIVIVIIY